MRGWERVFHALGVLSVHLLHPLVVGSVPPLFLLLPGMTTSIFLLLLFHFLAIVVIAIFVLAVAVVAVVVAAAAAAAAAAATTSTYLSPLRLPSPCLGDGRQRRLQRCLGPVHQPLHSLPLVLLRLQNLLPLPLPRRFRIHHGQQQGLL